MPFVKLPYQQNHQSDSESEFEIEDDYLKGQICDFSDGDESY